MHVSTRRPFGHPCGKLSPSRRPRFPLFFASGLLLISLLVFFPFNPHVAASTTLQDAALAAPNAVGAGTYEDNSRSVVYVGTWTRTARAEASGGTISWANAKGAKASLVVTGASSFSITTATGSNRGIANILVDGKQIAQFDGYGPVKFKVVIGPYPLPDAGQHKISLQVSGTKNPASSGKRVYLDNFIATGAPPPPPPPPPPGATARRVNAPFLSGSASYDLAAILWFGRVTATSNYSDVRVSYSDSELYVSLSVFDRLLWYNPNPSSGPLTAWDSATLYLNLDGNTGAAPTTTSYLFDAQLNWWEPRAGYQASYRGTGASWAAAPVAFTTQSNWRGNAPNDTTEDRGWTLDYHIPFSALGLSGPPPARTVWGLGLALHDRDDAAGTPISDQVWPETLSPGNPSSWGQLAFGLPTFTPPPAAPDTTVTLRNKLNGVTVTDAAVGGTTGNLCPGDSNYIWNQWGNANFAANPDFNIQNEADVSDWPCFAKYYVTFPLNTLPAGKAILSAKLTLHEYGSSGQPNGAVHSFIQVLTVKDDWNASSLTWNNAPLAAENVGGAWVDPVASFAGWPGVPWTFDVGGAVAQAYAAGKPLRLALYEADSAYHSGKYFSSSATGDWNEQARPTLTVVLGTP